MEEISGKYEEDVSEKRNDEMKNEEDVKRVNEINKINVNLEYVK
jgi:hypothetical protein